MIAFLIAILVAGALSFGGGWKAASAYHGVARQELLLKIEKEHSAALEHNLKILREAQTADQEAAEKAQTEIDDLQRRIDDELSKSTDSPALSSDAVDRVRRIFGN